MAMTPVDFEDTVPIDGYGPGFFRVGGKVLRGPVLVTTAGASAWGGLEDLAPLLALAGKIDVLFVGTGAEMARLDQAVAERLQQAGLMLETMATGPAARSFNLTLSEGRRVACALLPV